MSRPLRIEFEGAWYHVMNRGLAQNRIFLNDNHRENFLELLSETHERYCAEIHAYCMMGNHYHLLLRTPLANLNRIMRHLDGVYTQRFNRIVKRDGPLFRGRYKSILVDAEIYLLQLSRYIHLNPVKAKLVEKPEHYKWSSYQFYLRSKPPIWFHTKDTLSYFGDKEHKYKIFVEDGIENSQNEIDEILTNVPILGTDNFIKLVTEKYLKEEHKIDEIPQHKLLIDSKPSKNQIKEIITAVAAYYQISSNEIYAIPSKYGNHPRLIAMYLAFTLGQITHTDISRLFPKITRSGVSKAYLRFNRKIKTDKVLRDEIENIKEFLLSQCPDLTL